MKKLLELSQDYDVTLWRCDDLNFFMTCSENFMSLNLFFMDNHYAGYLFQSEDGR